MENQGSPENSQGQETTQKVDPMVIRLKNWMSTQPEETSQDVIRINNLILEKLDEVRPSFKKGFEELTFKNQSGIDSSKYKIGDRLDGEDQKFESWKWCLQYGPGLQELGLSDEEIIDTLFPQKQPAETK